MRKVLLLLVLCLSIVQAAPKERPAKEHRGFFFSSGLGLTYRSISYNADHDYYDCVTRKDEFSGFSIPSITLKFGHSFANFFAIYMDLDFDMATGTAKIIRRDYDWDDYVDEEVLTSKTTIKSEDNPGFSFSSGLSTAFYPFRNPNSVMNGFYFALGEYWEIFWFNINSDKIDTYSELGSIGSKIEIGKDWWVSDSWSVGTSIAYYVATVVFDEDAEGNFWNHKIQLTLHITRG